MKIHDSGFLPQNYCSLSELTACVKDLRQNLLANVVAVN